LDVFDPVSYAFKYLKVKGRYPVCTDEKEMLYSRVEATGAAIGDMELGRVVVLPVVGEVLWVLELLTRLIERRVSAVRSAHPAAWDSLRVLWGSDGARVDSGVEGVAFVALDPRVEAPARRTSEVTNRRSATAGRLTALSQISRDPNSASKHFRTSQQKTYV
jgi:hypothetical protein